MLICPQCFAENPNRNDVCQRCGVSLVENPCPQCGEAYNYGELACPHCKAVVGKILTVLITPLRATADQQENFDDKNNDIFDESAVSLNENYVDLGRRYKLIPDPNGGKPLQNLTVTEKPESLLLGRVADNQPLQPAVLKVLLAQHTEFLRQLPELEDADIVQHPTWLRLGLPASAIPYFRFDDLAANIPKVYDAWCEKDLDWILLEEREQLIPLETALKMQGLPGGEIQFWINQIFQLWQRLAPYGLARSLLITDNLFIDEDQILVLGLLHPNLPGDAPGLTHLGEMLQQVFAGVDALAVDTAALLHRVAQGHYDSIEAIQEELAAMTPFVSAEEIETEALDEDDVDMEPIETATDAEMAIHEVDFEQIPDEVIEAIAEGEEGESDQEGDGDDPSTMLDTDSAESSEVDDLPTAVLPMQLVSLVDAGYTDRGKNRQHNEDYFGMATHVETQRHNQGKTVHAHGIYVVCDGMGGHAAGEVASQLGVKTLLEFFKDEISGGCPTAEMIKEGICLANQKIYDINQDNASSGSGRMGTTLVMMIIHETTVAIAHVGDSRIYRITRKKGLEQLSIDHEVGQQSIQQGLEPEIAYARPDAYQLTQALGPYDETWIKPDIYFFDVEEDCLLFLCSDGISDNNFVEEFWEEALLPYISSSQDVEQGLRHLIESANEVNGHDNLTGVMVRVKVRPEIPMDVW